MRKKSCYRLIHNVVIAILLIPTAVAAQSAERNSLVERIGETGFIRVEVEGFHALDTRQKQLAYWLAQAAIAIDPIVYDQFSRFGLRQKRLLEELVAHSDGLAPDVKTRITDFAKLFWANRGNHNEHTSQKFIPAFTFDELKQAALSAQRHGAFRGHYADLSPITSQAELNKEIEALRRPFFDPQFEPMITAKTPPPGRDIIQESSNTFYRGVTLEDLKDFHEVYSRNSRVTKGKDGKLREEVYRAGTPDGKSPPRLYATYLKRANEYLAKAQQFADPVQAKVIADLIRFYQTGDPKDWLQFGTDWVQNDATVDFTNGFIEVYRDARNAKAISQGFVSVTDKPMTDKMNKLGSNAAYFEEKAPWDAKYKKQAFQLPLVKASETASETGDFEVGIIGDNLPNENEIHEKYGTKNFLFISSIRALNGAVDHKLEREFSATSEIAERNEKYGYEAEDLMTALHEVIGHGSGKLSDRLKSGAEPYLKEYFSTLEEARADLMALWNVWDSKLSELGLISNQEEVAKAMYDTAALDPLVQLRRILEGDTIEEDHERDRQLIVNYIRDKVPGSIGQFNRDGKAHIQVEDYQKMREGVGMLLAELLRIKAEGDYEAIKALVDAYGVRFDPAIRDQVVARYKALDLPTYFAGINAKLTPQVGADGVVRDVELSYPPDAIRQYLDYGSMYDQSLDPTAKSQCRRNPSNQPRRGGRNSDLNDSRKRLVCGG